MNTRLTDCGRDRPSLIRRLAVAALIVATSGTAGATAVYTYTSQDVDFTLTVVDQDTFTLRIQNATDASGDWGKAVGIGAIGFKALGIDFKGDGVSAALVSSPSASAKPSVASSWTYLQSELDGDGCQKPKKNGEKGVICFSANPSLALVDDMLFTVNLTGAVLDIPAGGPHLKVEFINREGEKVGSLLSENLELVAAPEQPLAPPVSLSGPLGAPPVTVPEPLPVTIVGLGLALIGMGRRRFPR